jgi:hypothetical protein
MKQFNNTVGSFQDVWVLITETLLSARFACGEKAMSAKSNNQIRKFLYGIVLTGMIFSLCLGVGGSPAAHAQEAGTETPTATPTGTNPPGGAPLINDALIAPDMPAAGSAPSSTGSSAPGYYDTSSYMIGSIAVGIILPESTGSNENWTTAMRDSVYSQIATGLDRWRAWGVTNNTNVSFTYEYYYAIPTAYEPIELTSGNECLWIAQVMTNLGYSGSTCYDQVRNYDNNLRTRLGTNWAVTIFVVNSL